MRSYSKMLHAQTYPESSTSTRSPGRTGEAVTVKVIWPMWRSTERVSGYTRNRHVDRCPRPQGRIQCGGRLRLDRHHPGTAIEASENTGKQAAAPGT